jgi:uncharacterized membrane protein YqjE
MRDSLEGPALGTLLRKTLSTGVGLLENRGELFMVELQEEKARMLNLIICGVGALFLAMMTVLLITGTVIFLVPEEYRVYAVMGFAVLYLAGTVWAVLRVKAMLKLVPFGETLSQFKKDRDLLEAFNE